VRQAWFSSGGSTLEMEKQTWKINLKMAGIAQCLFHYPPEASGKWSAARFQEVHHLPREVL
jgi:hypothetical protein